MFRIMNKPLFQSSERQVIIMSLAELNSLFKEDPTYSPREHDRRILMDLYVAPTEVEHTPENGYLKGRKVNEVDRFQIVKLVQNIAMALSKEQPGILDSPRELIKGFCEKGISVKAFQFCLGLAPKDIEDLKAGYRFPYCTSAWNAVFGDLEQKIASRKLDNEDELLRSTLFCVKNTRIKELRSICRISGRKFTEPEELIRYVTENGIPIPLLARALYMSAASIEDVADGTRPLSNSGITRLNRVMGEHFRAREAKKKISRHRKPLLKTTPAAE